MTGFLLQAVFAAMGLWLASKVLAGIEVHSVGSLIAAALLLGVVNALVKPIAFILTLPLTVITLGLFLLVLNGLMIGLVSLFLKGFNVKGLVAAILAAVIVSLTSWVGGLLFAPKGN